MHSPDGAGRTTGPPRGGQATVLVLAGMLTIMAGAVVSPALPGIRAAFAGTADADLLSRMITSTHALAIVVFAPFAGALSERIGRKRALIIGMLAFAAGGSSGFYLPDLYSILAGRIVLGIGVSLVMTTSVAIVADRYEGAERQRLLGRQISAGAFGGVLLLVGGGALAGLGWRTVFLVYLLGAVLAVAALRYLPGGGCPPATGGDAGSGTPARRWWPVGITAALAAMLLGQVAFYSVPVQVPFLVEDDFHATSIASGAVIAVQTLTTGLVSLRFAAIRRLAGEYVLVAVAFAAIGAGYLVLFAAPHVVVLGLGALVMGVGLGILMPTLNNWVVNTAPPDSRGRYAGFLTTALFLGQFLAPIVTQPAVSHLGIQPLFLIIAAGALIVAAGYLAASRHRTRVDAEPGADRAGVLTSRLDEGSPHVR
ncbi:MFS transporter [Plantactinospora sp. KBS50]|uniref:MFS transporter n=1 Tax=Plantactinospora sp. KBS50 TaxID=2024580 RepID=UPI0012FDDCF0|nr:MFS transporter [Plantactinospora sp. KBS50]